MAQGLKGLNQGGGYDWETPYLNYLVNLPEDQQELGQTLYNEYMFAKDYLKNNNINLGQGPIEDYTDLFHNIYTRFGGIPPQEQLSQEGLQPKKDSVLMTLDTVVPDVPEMAADNIRPLDTAWMEEVLPYIKDGGELNKQSYSEYIEDVGKKVIEGSLSLPNDKDFTKVSDIKARAKEISPEYKMRGEDSKTREAGRLQITDDQWMELGAMYDYLRQTEGQEEADAALAGRIKNMAADQQGFGEQLWRGFKGMGNEAAGAIVSTLGAVGSVLTFYPLWAEDQTPGLNGWQRYWDKVLDNPVTRYGKDVMDYGTLDPEYMKVLEENGGLSALQIYRTVQEESGSIADQIFNWSTIPVALQQGGFTVASMLTGAGEAKLAGGLFKGLAKGAAKKAVARGATEEALKATYKSLSNLGKYERIAYGYVIPALQGTGEAFFEGLDAKDRAYDAGMKELNQIQADMYQQEFDKYMNSGRAEEIFSSIYRQFHEGQNPMIVGSIMNELQAMPPEGTVARTIRDQAVQAIQAEIDAKFQEKWNMAKDQIDYVSARAGLQTVTWNMAINGPIFMTGKAALTNPKTRAILADSKMLGWTQRAGMKWDAKLGKNVPKYGVVAKAVDVVKEPGSEFIEEYVQNVTQDTKGAKAEYNIHNYLDRMYNHDIIDEIGTTYKGQHAAALSALGESLGSKESVVAGIYGLISSVMGTPGKGLSNYRSVGPDGKTHWDAFERRTVDGKQESFREYFGRVVPWRTSVTEGIHTVREKQRALDAEAQALNDWLSDSDNMQKFKNAGASVAWAGELQNHAYAGDEFGYRNSNLGKTVNDAFMFGKLKKTNKGMYESLIKLYQEATNLVEGSEEAEKFMQQVNANKSDNEKLTVQDIKDNAKHFLETIEQVQKEDQDLRQTFGDIDEEVRQALVYGKMALEDFTKRGKQIDEEIATVLPKTGLKDSVEGTVGVTQQIGEVVAKYGNTKESLEKAATNLKTKASEKDAQVSKLKNEAGKAKNKAIAEDKKSQARKIKDEAKALRKEARSIDEALKFNKQLNSGQIAVSESQILNASPEVRAEMLNPKNFKNFSKQQQDVIQRVIGAGQQAVGPQFLNKALDSGKLSEISKNFVKEYSELIANPNSLQWYSQYHKGEVQKAFARRQALAMAEIDNYKEFADMLDKARYEGSKVQQNVIFRTLKEKAPQKLEGYLKFKADSEEILNQLQNDEAFDNLFDDDKALMTYAVNYLANDPISDTEAYRDNPEKGVSKLLEKDQNGKSRFGQYIESVLPPEVSINRFDLSDEHVADLYRTLIDRANKNRDNVQNATAETPTDKSDSNPGTTVEPTPGEEKPKGGGSTSIFSQLPTSVTQEAQARQNSPQAPIEPNINTDVAQQVEKFRVLINSSEGNPNPKNALALEAIEELNLNTAEDVTDLLNQLTSVINTYKSSGDTAHQKAAQVLDWVKVKTMSSSPQNIFNGRTPTYPNSKDMTTLPLVSSKWSSDPNSPNYRWFTELAEKYQISEFLKTGALTAETPVYFYTNQEYMNLVEASMAKSNLQMGVDSYPLIAVVEVTSEEGKKFAFPVEGKNGKGEPEMHYYRPIGVMPSSLNKDFNGAASTKPIRDAIDPNNVGKLITDQTGQVIEGRVKRIVGQIPSKGGANAEAQGGYNRRDLIDLMVEAFVPGTEVTATKEALKDPQKRKEFLKSAKFRDLINRFFEDATRGNKFKKKRNQGVESLYYTASTLFIPHTNGGNPNEKDWIVATKDLVDTTNLDGDSFVDVLKTGNGKDIRDFNSRTRRYIDKMISILKDFNPIDETSNSPKLSVTQRDDQLVSTNDSLKELEKTSKQLNDSLKDFITFRTGINAEYSIQLVENEDGSGYHYELILKNNLGDINLGSIWESTFRENRFGVDEAAGILANLCLDENVGIRTDPTAGKYRELIKWGVSYPDIMGTSSNQEMAAENRLDLISDNILAMSVSSLIMQPTSVEIHSPGSFRAASTAPANPETKVAQPDQATTNPVGPGGQGIAAVTTDGSTVQDDGLVVEKGTQKPADNPLIGDLTSRSVSSRENVEISSDGSTLTVAGTTTYYRLPSVMNLESSTEIPQQALDACSVIGYEVIPSPITVRFQLPVTNMDGTTVQVNLANDQVRLLVEEGFGDPRIGILIQADEITKEVEQMLSLTWHMAESYLGKEINFARVSLKNGEMSKQISRGNLRTGFDYNSTLSKLFLQQLNQVITPQSSAVSTSSEELNITHVNPIVETDDGLSDPDFSGVDDFENDLSDTSGDKSQTSNLPSRLQQPEVQYGIWRKQNGISRTQKEIEEAKQKLAAYEGIHNEQEYNAWMEQQFSMFQDANFVIQAVQQIIGC